MSDDELRAFRCRYCRGRFRSSELVLQSYTTRSGVCVSCRDSGRADAELDGIAKANATHKLRTTTGPNEKRPG